MPEEQQEIVEQAAAPSEESTTATESATGESQEPQTEEAQKARGGFQRRIDKLTREKAQAAQETEYWRQQALRTAPAVETTRATAAADAEPSENDFETHAAYVKAITKWTVSQELKAGETKQREETVRTEAKKQREIYDKSLEEFRAKTPDFDDLLQTAIAEERPMTPVVLAELTSSENGPEILYYLLQHPDEAEALNDLKPLALSRAMGRIESRFTTAPSAKTAITTKAPPPPNAVGRSSATSVKDPGDMSLKEFEEWRRKTSPNLFR